MLHVSPNKAIKGGVLVVTWIYNTKSTACQIRGSVLAVWSHIASVDKAQGARPRLRGWNKHPAEKAIWRCDASSAYCLCRAQCCGPYVCRTVGCGPYDGLDAKRKNYIYIEDIMKIYRKGNDCAIYHFVHDEFGEVMWYICSFVRLQVNGTINPEIDSHRHDIQGR